MFGKRKLIREFKLREFNVEPPAPETDNDENEKHVRFSSPNRSSYPRLLDNWPVFAIIGLLTLFTILVMRWMSR